MIFLALRPPIEIRDVHLRIGRRTIPWSDVRKVDRTGWLSPLIVRLALSDDSSVLLVYPGDQDSSHSLLRHLRRMSRDALIDGVPYQQFWTGQLPPGLEPKGLPSPRYRLLRPEDEAEVEQLYHRLKTVGRLDPKNSAEEK